MHVLALDTTTAAGSVAIATNGRIVDVRLLDSARPQTTQLPGAVLDLLAGAGMVLGQIDAFAVAIGPGSFSGIRIGIACTQGLALVANRPAVPISALDALVDEGSSHVRLGGVIAAWVNGQRHEVFSAAYRVDENGGLAGATEPPVPSRRDSWSLSAVTPAMVGPADSIVADWRERGFFPEVVIGDGVAAYGATLPAGVIRRGHPALATAVARLGWRAAQRGETIDPAHIQPLYIRRPDVEIARDARRAAPR